MPATCTLSLYPPFAHMTDLNDVLHKLAFYLKDYPETVDNIQVWRTGALQNESLTSLLQCPSYLDPVCATALQAMLPIVTEPAHLEENNGLVLHPADESYVIVWDSTVLLPGAAPLPQVLQLVYEAGRVPVMDRTHSPGDAGAMQYLFYKLEGGRERRYAQSRISLERAAAACQPRAAKSYLFGPGPSLLDGVTANTFDDGIRLVCNSIVTSPDLMQRIDPDFICFADDFLHGGAILYAGEFRKGLQQAMAHSRAYIVTRAVFQRPVQNLLPEPLRSRVIGVTCDTNMVEPNFNLRQNLAIKDTGNVLTMFLLPLAATFSSAISLIGFDGRGPQTTEQYWAHSAALPIEELRWSLTAAHPVQGTLSGEAFVKKHEATVETYCGLLEKAGKSVKALTPSFIPAFSLRQA